MENRWYITQQTFSRCLNRNAIQFGTRRAQIWRMAFRYAIDHLCGAMAHREGTRVGTYGLGIEKGDRAAVMSHTCPQWLWADYSILCAAGITVCVYPTLSAKEMSFIINDSGSKILYVQDEEILERAIAAWPEMPTLEKIIVMKDDIAHSDPRVLSLSQLRALGVKFLSRDKILYETRWRSVEITDKMTIVYTSGTTGRQKGAVHTHFSINSACCRDMRIVPEYRPDDVMLSFLPLAHTYERECGHGTAMCAAVCIAYSSPQTSFRTFRCSGRRSSCRCRASTKRIYMAMRDMASQSPVKKKYSSSPLKRGSSLPRRAPTKTALSICRKNIDFTEGIGRWLVFKYKLVDKLVFSKRCVSASGEYRFAFSAAGSLPADLCKVFMAMGIRIYKGYGSTGTCNTVNLNRPARCSPDRGAALQWHQGRISEIGEWEVRGDNIITEYWNNPEATKETFTEDGFYKTGDVVQMLADGYIKIVDRIKGIMVLDTGKNVPTAKIESLFSVSRFVDIVVPIADEKPYVSALVVPKYDAFIQLFDKEGISYDKSKLVFFGEGAARMCIKVGDDFIANEKLKKLVDETSRPATRNSRNSSV